jgi:hypothetical protein
MEGEIMTRKDGRKARTVANYKYNLKTYDQVSIRVKKGIRADFNAACKLEGISAADYLTRCIMELIRKHGTEGTEAETTPGGAKGNDTVNGSDNNIEEWDI